MAASIGNIEMLGFCLSNTFDPTRSGTTITGITPEDFMTQINQRAALELGTVEISNEYPDICRHFFVKNDFTTTLQGVVKASDDVPVISKMVTRGGQEGVEEPYLAHWVESKSVEVPKAEFLDVILYSREHLKNEGIVIEGDWGVVTVLGVPTCEQTPPTRTTIERNAAGVDAGGNGKVVTAAQLSESDAYWYPTGQWVNVK